MLKYFRQFKTGIKNLIRWFPVIWTDRDWDEYYIYELLHKKLEHMEQFYRSDYAMTADAHGTSDQIKIAKDTLKRIIEHNYLSEELEEYHKIYGVNDKLFTIEPIEGKKSSQLVWTKNEEQRQMFSEAGDRADRREQEDLDFLFKHLREHIEGWWD